MQMKLKIREWLKRYLPAEVLSFAATLIAAGLTYRLSNDQITTALAATWAGNIAYFGYILFADILATRRKYSSSGKAYSGSALSKNIRALIVEFGVAEVVDSFLIRPALMYYFPIWTGSLVTGISLAKIVADITFYVPAIIGYELNKKYHLNK